MQHVGGGGEAGGVAAQYRLMQQVLGDHGLAEAVGADDHDVGGGFQEAEGEELIEERAIELLGPVVVEVGHGFEGAEAGVVHAAFEAATQPLALFDLQHPGEPGLLGDFLDVGEEPVEVQPPQPLFERIKG
jgi:hypothetical protein